MGVTNYEKLNYPNGITLYRAFTINNTINQMSITERYVSDKNDRVVIVTKQYDGYKLTSCILSTAFGSDIVDECLTFDCETDANLYAEMFMNGMYVNNSDTNEK